MYKNDFWNSIQTLIDKNVRRSFDEMLNYSNSSHNSTVNINGNGHLPQRTGTNGRKIPLDGIFDASTPRLPSMRMKNNKDSPDKIRFVIHRDEVPPADIPLPKFDISDHPGIGIDLDSIPPPPPPLPEHMPLVSPIVSPEAPPVQGSSSSSPESGAISTDDEPPIPNSNRSVVRKNDSRTVVQEENMNNHGDIDYRNRSNLSQNFHQSDRNSRYDVDYRSNRNEKSRRYRYDDAQNDDDRSSKRKHRRSSRSRSRSPYIDRQQQRRRKDDLRQFLDQMTDQYHKPLKNYRRDEDFMSKTTENGNFQVGNKQNLSFGDQRFNQTIGYQEEAGKFTFFFTKKYPFSNHYPCRYENDGRIFTCTEQEYMFEKAKLFNDKQSMEDIMDTSDPKLMKNLGRRVAGFDQRRWDAVSYNIMLKANRAKYTQNRDLRLALFTTEGTTLVETNPMDPTWGIGMGIDDPRRWYKSQWRGKNWLGEILTTIRDELAQKIEYEDELSMVRAAKEQFIFWE